MSKITITDDHYEMIVKGLHNRTCFPFLGAGVNFPCDKEEKGLPLGGEVALRLLEAMMERRKPADPNSAVNTDKLGMYRERSSRAANKIREELPTKLDKVEDLLRDELRSILPDNEQDTRLAHVIIDDALEQFRDLTRVALQDLARVSLRYRDNKDLPNFVAKLKEIIPDTKRKPSLLLRTLARLPLRLIVTTNYDRLMERALELFEEDDITGPRELTLAVGGGMTPLAQSIRRAVPEPMRSLLRKYGAPSVAEGVTPAHWAAALNYLIQEKSIHLLSDASILKDGLTLDVWRRVSKGPEKVAEVAMNRQLLESSFPGLIRPHYKPYRVLVQPVNGFQGTSVKDTQKILSEGDDGLVLYKLHGTFTDDVTFDEKTRPVITEEDYIEFLTFVGRDGIDNQIKKDIRLNTILFLGYGLEDWSFRTLFKGLIETTDPSKQRVSYAIQKSPSDFWVSFWHKKNVHILDVDICEFTRKLDQHCRDFLEARRKEAEEEEIKLQDEWREEPRDEGAGQEQRRAVRYAKY
jgi:hypothetical protein